MDLSGALAVIDTEVPQRFSGSKLLSQLVMACGACRQVIQNKKACFFLRVETLWLAIYVRVCSRIYVNSL